MEDIYKKIVLDFDGKQEEGLPIAIVDSSFFISAVSGCDSEVKGEIPAVYIEELIKKNGQLVVPQVFWFEVGNILLNMSRKNSDKKELSSNQLFSIIHNLSQLPFYTDPQPDGEIMLRVMNLSQEYNISFYDAAYLELALRKNLPLKTCNKQLMELIK